MTFDDLLRKLTEVARQLRDVGLDRHQADATLKESICRMCDAGPLVTRLAFIAQVTPAAVKAVEEAYR